MAIMLNNKTDNISRELFKFYRELQDNMNDGFVQWEYKKSLIDAKYIIDNMLTTSSKFGSIEEDYIKQKEQEKLIGILKK